MHQPLHTVVQLHEKAEAGNAADDALKGITHKLLHVLHLLEVSGITLCIYRDALPLGGMVCPLCQLLHNLFPLVLRDGACLKGLPQQAVHHQVRIAADWRGKVGIILCCQSEVPQVFRRVPCLLHGAQGNSADDFFRRASGNLFQCHLQVLRPDAAVSSRSQVQPEGIQKPVQCRDLAFLRLLMDAVNKRLLAAAHVLSHGLIGSQHALLNDGLAQVAHTLLQSDRLAVLIQLHLDFRDFKIDGAPAMTILVHGVPDILQIMQQRHDVLIIPNKFFIVIHEDFINQSIGQAAIDMDDHWQDFVIRHLALRADVHLAGHGKPVHASIQAADTVGQCLWQHRHNPVHQVDAGTPCLRLHIKGLMLTDIPADIGNIDTQEKAAVILLFHINAIVQILGILAINGDDFQVPPVLPAVPANMLLSIDGLLHPIRSGLHLSREALRKVILAHDGQDIHSRLSLLADDLDNPALRLLLAIRPPGDLRHHLGAGNGIHGLTLRNVNIRLQTGIIGSHKAKTATG